MALLGNRLQLPGPGYGERTLGTGEATSVAASRENTENWRSREWGTVNRRSRLGVSPLAQEDRGQPLLQWDTGGIMNRFMGRSFWPDSV